MNEQHEKIFLKKLQDCIIGLDELDELVNTNSERQSHVDLELSDWLHHLQNNFEAVSRASLANIAEKIGSLRLERASLRNEYELIRRYKELSNRMMSKDNRQFIISEIQKTMKNLNQPYQNRIIDEKIIANVEAITIEEKNQEITKPKRQRKESSKELDQVLLKMKAEGRTQREMAVKVGITQASVSVRLKRLKEVSNV